MSNSVVLKHPAEFFTLGSRHLRLCPCDHRWSYLQRHGLVDRFMDHCMQLVVEPLYTKRCCDRFEIAAANAIAFVVNRTHQEFPVKVGLSRFMNEGERCVTLSVDGHPLPELPIDLPTPSDPDLMRYNIKHHFAHARILAQADGYMICWDDRILQLDLSWSEQAKIQ